jgi:hypothetical protein
MTFAPWMVTMPSCAASQLWSQAAEGDGALSGQDQLRVLKLQVAEPHQVS